MNHHDQVYNLIEVGETDQAQNVLDKLLAQTSSKLDKIYLKLAKVDLMLRLSDPEKATRLLSSIDKSLLKEDRLLFFISCTLQGVIYWSNNKINKAMEELDGISILIEDLDKLTSSPVDFWFAYFYNIQGLILHFLGKNNEAIESLEKGIIYAQRSNHLNRYCSLLDNLGLMYRYDGDLIQALKFHSHALELKQDIGNNLAVAKAYGNIGELYDITGETSRALNQYFKAIEIFEKEQDSTNLSICYNDIGILFYRRNNSNKALEFFNKALEISSNKGNNYHSSLSLFYKILASIDFDLENYVMQNLEQMEQIAVNTEIEIIKSRHKLIKAYYLSKQVDQDKAETGKRLLREVIFEKNIDYELHILATIKYEEILIQEITQKETPEKLYELILFNSEVENMAQSNNITPLLVQTKIIMAQLELLQLNKQIALEKIEEAMEIAKNEGLTHLYCLSKEEENFIVQSWEKIKHMSDKNLVDRIIESGLIEFLKNSNHSLIKV